MGGPGGCLVQMGPGTVGLLPGTQGDLWSCLSTFILSSLWLLVLSDLGRKPGTQYSKPAGRHTDFVSALSRQETTLPQPVGRPGKAQATSRLSRQQIGRLSLSPGFLCVTPSPHFLQGRESRMAVPVE